MTLQDNALAAIQQLTAPQNPDTRPPYELLDEFYTLDPSERYHVWERLKQDDRLLLLFKYLAMPLLGGEIGVEDVPQVKAMLSDILASSLSEKLITKCNLLAAYLYKKGF
jgi:hypothetical protein